MARDFTNFHAECHGPVPLRGSSAAGACASASRTIDQSRDERAQDFQVRSFLTASGACARPVSCSWSAPAGSPASAAGRHLLRLSHNPATETLYADITQRLTT